MDSFDEDCWVDLIDYSGLLNDVGPPTDLYWNPQLQSQSVTIDASLGGTTSQVIDAEKESQRKRGHSDQGGGTGTKACRERMRREKLNDRFSELAAILEHGRPMKNDKLAMLGDAIRILNQLKRETKEHTEMNERLLAEIKNLKAEKNELREEKIMLKADKERIEKQLEVTAVLPTGFMAAPPPPPVYPAELNKVPMFPSYGFVPMWQYIPPSARDTSQDHELWPPAA